MAEGHSMPNTRMAHSFPPACFMHYSNGTACTATTQVLWVPLLFACGDLLHVGDVVRLNNAVFSFR
eukprot:2711650-Pyramimonas_sp.AAC.1